MLAERKKGEITNEQIIGIVILLIGVGIILWVYFTINWTGTVDDSVCHESVVLRGTLPSIAEIQNIAPLKCKTDKICVSGEAGGKCGEYSGAKEVTPFKAEEINDINRAVSQEVVSCWQMMGEGKLSLFDPTFVGQVGGGRVYSSCVICSRVAFDEESLKSQGIDLTKLDVNQYMRSHKMPTKNSSYYDYLAGENGKVEIGNNLVSVNNVEVTNEKDKTTSPEQGTVALEPVAQTNGNIDEEVAILFMQVSAKKGTVVFGNTMKSLGVVWGASFYVNPIKTLTATGSALVNPYTYAIAGTVLGAQQINAWANRNVAAGYCGDVSYGNDARDGCSVVRVVKYNLEDLNKYCGRIESIS